MTPPDFLELRTILVEIARIAIKDFAMSANNRDVYAFVFDLNEEYGSVIISVNTLASYGETRERYENSKFSFNELEYERLSGIKYNSGDFSFIDIGPKSPQLDRWAENYFEYLDEIESEADYQLIIERFSDAVAAAIGDLESEFTLLDRTDNFIAYHCYHDMAEDVQERLIRKTVHTNLFDQLFPELLQYRQFSNDLNSENPQKAAETWVSFLQHHALGGGDPVAEAFFSQKSYFDVKRELIALGETALPPIFRLLDQLIYKPQFNEDGSAEFEAEGAATRFVMVSYELISTIAEIGLCDEKVESKLLAYIERLDSLADTEQDPIGPILGATARVLYSLLPDKYEAPIVDDTNNRLLNVRVFRPNSRIH